MAVGYCWLSKGRLWVTDLSFSLWTDMAGQGDGIYNIALLCLSGAAWGLGPDVNIHIKFWC